VEAECVREGGREKGRERGKKGERKRRRDGDSKKRREGVRQSEMRKRNRVGREGEREQR